MKKAIEFLGKIVKVKVDRPLGSKHPKFNWTYPINYGSLPKTKAEDGEEIDAYILGVDKPLKEFEGKVIAIVFREDDNEFKLVVAPEGKDFSKEEIEKQIYFQEKFFKSKVITKNLKRIKMKITKKIYTTLTIILGLMVSFILHAIIEIIYISYSLSKNIEIQPSAINSKCYLPSALQIFLILAGLLGGYFLGKICWKKSNSSTNREGCNTL